MNDLVVADTVAVALATLDQLKAQLGVRRPVHDDELKLYLGAASNVVRGMVVFDATAVPPEVKLATLIIAEHLWETQRGDGNVRPGVGGGNDEDSLVRSRGYLIPHRAAQLLASLPSRPSQRPGPVFSFPLPSAWPA